MTEPKFTVEVGTGAVVLRSADDPSVFTTLSATESGLRSLRRFLAEFDPDFKESEDDGEPSDEQTWRLPESTAARRESERRQLRDAGRMS